MMHIRIHPFRSIGAGALLVGLILGVPSRPCRAQTEPGTAVPGDPFEVHGLLYSGSAPAGAQPGDAWAQGATYLGVLDDDGLPALGASGAPFRASRLVDENWGNAGHGFDPTLFDGGNKNSDLIGVADGSWEWAGGGGSPQKNDITNAYFHTRVDPATGDRWVFVAAETRSVNGDSHADFEFNQAGVIKVGETGGQLIGQGPAGGRTVNDFLISVDFERGGEHPVATVRFWDGAEFVPVSMPGTVFSATNFADIPHGENGAWKHFDDDGAEVNVLTHLQLVEGAANLTAMGIGVDPCSTDATFMVKTRSSSSWTSDLKDFAIVYFPLEPPPEVVIDAPTGVCSGASFEASATELTGLPNTTLEWSIAGCGEIVSDPFAEAATVQADLVCGCDIVLSVTAIGGECRHTVVASATVSVGDDGAPALSGEPTDLTAECDAVPPADELTATDDCFDVPVTLEEVEQPGTCVGNWTTTRTWSAVDGCDNASSHTQIVTVVDTMPPQLDGVPIDAAVSCDAVPPPAEVSASDNCSDATVSFDQVVTPGGCQGDESIARTWTATDLCRNEESQTQVLTVFDDAAPELAGVPADATYECDSLPDPPEVTATDNCSDATVGYVQSIQPGECVGESSVTRTWSATDDCGNQDVSSQLITLIDTTPPTLVGVPGDAVVECDAVPEPPPVTATDNCSEPVVALSEQGELGPGAGKAVITRIWTATDDCGNQTTGTQILTVIDTTPPELVGVPEDTTVECDAIPEPPVVTATDNCADPSVEFNETTDPGSCEGNMVITRTWTATDDCGNRTTATQVITVVDTTAPVLLDTPLDETSECDAVPPPADVNATDNCSTPGIAFSETTDPGECIGESFITRTWTATDPCGNQSSYAQLIHVVDTTAPAINGDPPDTAVECDAVPDPVVLTADDNCDPDVSVDLGEQVTPGICEADYTVLRTWSSVDDCGNEASVDQTVAVQDTTPPVIRFEPNRTQFICDGRPVVFTASVSDNCVQAALSMIDITAITANNRDRVLITPQPSGGVHITVTGPAMVMGTLEATDDCGNASSLFDFTVFGLDGWEACSQGFWRNHKEAWGPTGFSPDTSLLDAFQIHDLSSPEIPAGFDTNLTLHGALNTMGGTFNHALLQGTAALLNAAHPRIDFPATVEQVRATMQAAFAGDITFDEAQRTFTTANAAEAECGCPIS